MILSSTEIDVLNAERRVARALTHPTFGGWLKKDPAHGTGSRPGHARQRSCAAAAPPAPLVRRPHCARSGVPWHRWRCGLDGRESSSLAAIATVSDRRASWTPDPRAERAALIRAKRKRGRQTPLALTTEYGETARQTICETPRVRTPKDAA